MSTRRSLPIVVEGVWKWYRRERRHDTLRDLVVSAVGAVRRSRARAEANGFWALRDVSLRVEPGEVLAIIGANGAGKSTLLKLLTGILEPTRGGVAVRGRVGALIEVSAGFHSELSGRENVFLQGAVMGMPKREIERRFDEIVEFAGVHDFIDVPVKRYSSGMSARLGFAVAAHLDPDVLLIDEVLAVGDHAFQRRAVARIGEIVRSGIPAVIVSHQMERVLALATHAVLLADGAVARAGTPADCVAAYLDGEHLAGGARARSVPLRFGDSLHVSESVVDPGQRVTVSLPCEIVDGEGAAHAVIGVRVRRLPSDATIFATNSRFAGVTVPREGRFALEVDLQMNVGAGHYQVQAVVWRADDLLEWSRGPSAIVEVSSSNECVGPHYLQPQLRLSDVCAIAPV